MAVQVEAIERSASLIKMPVQTGMFESPQPSAHIEAGAAAIVARFDPGKRSSCPPYIRVTVATDGLSATFAFLPIKDSDQPNDIHAIFNEVLRGEISLVGYPLTPQKPERKAGFIFTFV